MNRSIDVEMMCRPINEGMSWEVSPSPQGFASMFFDPNEVHWHWVLYLPVSPSDIVDRALEWLE